MYSTIGSSNIACIVDLSSKPPPIRTLLPILQHICIHILRLQINPLLLIPPPILILHPQPKPQREHDARRRARRSRRQRRHVLRRILDAEGRAAQDPAQVPQSDQDPCRRGPRVLAEVVVVVPGLEEAGGNVGARGEEEHAEVRDAFVLCHVDGGEDDRCDEGEGQREADVEGPFAEVVGGPGHDQEDDEADEVWGDGHQVGFDDAVAEALDDLYGTVCKYICIDRSLIKENGSVPAGGSWQTS